MMSNPEQMKLQMKFDVKTIKHLGVQLYSTLPPVLAELVSNAYDANAEHVVINLIDDDEKKIIISDDGTGMTFDEINEKFLLIGRDRREAENRQQTEGKERYIIGRKGLGKLSFFGIAETIEISTVRNNYKTIFKMNWPDIIRGAANEYYPELLSSESTSESSGTVITLSNIKRKSGFDIESIAFNLSKYFQVFDEPDFEVKIIHSEKQLVIENKLKYKNIEMFCSWEIPGDMPQELADAGYYEYNSKIKGKLIATTETVSSPMRGIALFSRGKLVNDHDFLQVKATSHGYSYITGWIDVSFIEDFEIDTISTDRQSLIWELHETEDLRSFLEDLYRKFFNFQKTEREKKKKEEVKELSGIDLDDWYTSLPKHESKLAKKIVESIIVAEGIDIQKAAELIGFTKDSFQFESFKELAAELEETGLEDQQKVLLFFKEWKLVEAKEMYKIAIIRIETIQKFKKHIENNSREVPELHNFLRQFPWLLDPRIMTFRDEVTYSKLLKENFKEPEDMPDSDRRIDFLCQNFPGSFFVIELKRPKNKISLKELEQALDYSSFIQSKISQEFQSKVTCYIIGKSLVDKPSVQSLAESLRHDGKVIFKSYEDLLSSAIKYHQEFIDQYEGVDSVNNSA